MTKRGRGLECAFCGGGILAVKDSRPSHSSIRRRRKCLSCERRITTYEVVSSLDDERDLGAALQMWDKLRAIPEHQRAALVALINASAVLALPPTFAPPLIIDAKPE